MSGKISDFNLNQCTILVTRPIKQAPALNALIVQSGGSVINLPTIEIKATKLTSVTERTCKELENFDIAIFVSVNSVEFALPIIKKNHSKLPQMIAAIGQSTAKSLINNGIHPNIKPKKAFNSEALLALPEMSSVEDKRIVIFRGKGGRETLKNGLSKRGADVCYADIYTRHRPNYPSETLTEISNNQTVDIIIVTSNQGLKNLYDIFSEHRSWLLNQQLIVLSQRATQLAAKLSFKKTPLIVEKASNEFIVETIKQWYHNPA